MKRLSMLLIPCIAISANAATFNAQGKTINSNDAKNPGIVKFEKNKAVAAKNNQNKPAALAKTYTPVQVTATKGVYDQNTRKYELNNNTNIPEAQYLSTIDQLEKADNPRKNDWSRNYYDQAMTEIPNKTDNLCKVVSYYLNSWTYRDYGAASYELINESGRWWTRNLALPHAIGYYDHYIYYSPEIYDHSYNFDMGSKASGHSTSDRCYGQGHFGNTCGQGINIYNIAGDAPVTFNGNSCVDSRRANYKEGLKHYYANEFIKRYAEQATIHYYKDRNGNGFARHPEKPYEKNMHIGNIISSAYKNQTSYSKEAAALDDYIYNNRVIEFAHYTNEGGKTGAGLALNAITVGGVTGQPTPHHTLLEETQELPLLKSGESRSKYEKPELYNVSNGLFDADFAIVHDDNEYVYQAITDAWGASTVSATMTADLLQKHPFYKWHPEVVKALWMSASAQRTDYPGAIEYANGAFDYTNIYKDRNTDYVQASLVTFEDLLFNNKSRYWYGNNTDFLTNNEITFTEDVEPGQMYNFAIAWLVRGDYALYDYNLSSRFRLTISYKLPSGKTIPHTTSDVRLRTFVNAKRISIPDGVNKVTVTIERTRNTGDRIILGYNMHKMRYK